MHTVHRTNHQFRSQVSNDLDVVIKSHTQLDGVTDIMQYCSLYVSQLLGMSEWTVTFCDDGETDQYTTTKRCSCSENGLQKFGLDRMSAMPLGYRPGFRSTGCRKCGRGD